MRRIFVLALEELPPCPLLLFRGHGEQANGLHADRVLVLSIGVADLRYEIAKRQPLFDGGLGDAKQNRDLIRLPSLVDQSREGLILRHFVGVEPGHVFDERGFQGGGIIILFHDAAGKRRVFTAVLVGNGPGRIVSTATGNDLEAVARFGPSYHQRLLNAFLANVRQDVVDVGRLAVMAHVERGNVELVEWDFCVLHGSFPRSGRSAGCAR